VKKLVIAAALAFTISGGAWAQNPAAPGVATPEMPERSSEPGSERAGPSGLSDLEKTTFACPKAALNAAAREAATYPSEGIYQFSYFNIVSGSHHAAYEVHFTSNYAAEPVLKFCVAIYCQQGFDPATTRASVALIGVKAEAKAAAHAGGAGHAADACNPPRTPARRRTR
jgi:hypothetical protein